MEIEINYKLFNDNIKDVVSFFGSFFNENKYFNEVLQKASKDSSRDMRNFTLVFYQLVINNIINIDRGKACLSELGNSVKERLLFDEYPHITKVDFCSAIKGETKEEIINQLWDFIGPDNCMFKISGPKFYRLIREFLPKLPPNLSDYQKEIMEKGRKSSLPSRSTYYRTLFLQLNDVQIDPFMRKLSQEVTKEINKEQINSDMKSLEAYIKENNHVTTPIVSEREKRDKEKVFIVHGHESQLRSEVENMIWRLNFKPSVLFKEPNGGKTIIEKLIDEIDEACFGIVLYTSCDLGKDKNDDDTKIKPRARQNVVFEHGYLYGKLGRNKVVALVETGVEVPGDLSGVVYISRNDGDWQRQIVKEMQEAGLKADANLL